MDMIKYASRLGILSIDEDLSAIIENYLCLLKAMDIFYPDQYTWYWNPEAFDGKGAAYPAVKRF